jgi:hypothetical protein
VIKAYSKNSLSSTPIQDLTLLIDGASLSSLYYASLEKSLIHGTFMCRICRAMASKRGNIVHGQNCAVGEARKALGLSGRTSVVLK